MVDYNGYMDVIISGFDGFFISIVNSWPRSWNDFMHALSFVGQPLITITILSLIAIYGLRWMKYRYTYASLIALAAFGFNSLLKLAVHRQRPLTYVPPEDLIASYSFPSGHAAGATLAYGLIAYIVWCKVSNVYIKFAAITILALLVIGVGVSRVYLGDHYPSDVVAGWLVGAAGLSLIIWKARLS